MTIDVIGALEEQGFTTVNAAGYRAMVKRLASGRKISVCDGFDGLPFADQWVVRLDDLHGLSLADQSGFDDIGEAIAALEAHDAELSRQASVVLAPDGGGAADPLVQMRQQAADEIIALFGDRATSPVLKHVIHAAFMRGAIAGAIHGGSAVVSLNTAETEALLREIGQKRSARAAGAPDAPANRPARMG